MNPKPPAVMQSVPWDDELGGRVSARLGADLLEMASYLGQPFLVVRAEAVVALLEWLRLDEEFDFLTDLTAVDYPTRAERFELVYFLYSFARNSRLRIKVPVSLGQKPQSVVGVFRGANWMEREIFDMFGIEFAGHPNMRRILMPDEWTGFPLRKDYGILQMDNRWVQENLGIESGQ